MLIHIDFCQGDDVGRRAAFSHRGKELGQDAVDVDGQDPFIGTAAAHEIVDQYEVFLHVALFPEMQSLIVAEVVEVGS